jgi:carbon-monoxide dehydrogenase small subunit
MKLAVNGVEHIVDSAPLTSLLDVLRDVIGITSPKVGCDQGGCGACTVLVGGEPRRSCLVPVAMLDGASVTTVEGLGAPHELSPVQAAFHEGYAAQCGFCTPGMLIAAHALVERTGRPLERDEIIAALGGHFCRCTGYAKIVQAVQAASRGEVAVERVFEPAREQPVEIPGAPA